MDNQPGQLIGVIPAAGIARRLAGIPCSKEIYPVALETGADPSLPPVRVASQYLLEKMKHAGVDRIYFILRRGKWDIPEFYGDGARWGVHLSYLIMEKPFGPACTLDQARPFARDATVAFGFPDILFHSRDGFARLLARQRETGADVVLGLFRSHNPAETDAIERDARGRVVHLSLKPARTDFMHTWNIAVWSPAFTEFLHQYVAGIDAPLKSAEGRMIDYSVGHALQAALKAGLHLNTVLFDGPYLDIGSPERLRQAGAFLRNAPSSE